MKKSFFKSHLLFLIAVVLGILIFLLPGSGILNAQQSSTSPRVYANKPLDLRITSSSRRIQDIPQDENQSDKVLAELLKKAQDDAKQIGDSLLKDQDDNSNQDDQNPQLANQVGPEQVLLTRPLMDLNISPVDTNDPIPKDRSGELAQLRDKARQAVAPVYPPRLVCWVAPNIRYNPLYFEDVVLERYGQTYGPVIQPWASATRFFIQGAALPYNVFIKPPCSCDSPLGFCRPGNPTPNQRQALILRK